MPGFEGLKEFIIEKVKARGGQSFFFTVDQVRQAGYANPEATCRYFNNILAGRKGADIIREYLSQESKREMALK